MPILSLFVTLFTNFLSPFRHCICCFKDNINVIRFNNLVQSIVVSSFNLLRAVINILNNESDLNESVDELAAFDDWTSEDKEKLLLLKSKACPTISGNVLSIF